MSSESRDRADEETIAELKARVEQLESKVEAPSVSRRSLLAAGGGGLAALLFGSATASAGTNEVGTIGEANSPIDVVAEDIYGPGGQGSNDAVAFEAINSQSLSGITIIQSGDDYQSKVEGASAGDRILVEPGASFTIDNPPVSYPDEVTVDAGVDRGVTVTKAANGDLAEWGSHTVIRGHYFDCNKSSHTGDGLVTKSNGDFRSRLINCRIEDAAGDALVLDGRFYDEYVACRFRRADGYGVRMIDTGGAECSSTAFRGGTDIRSNGSGGVKIDGSNITHGIKFESDCVIEENNGPAIEVTGDVRDIQVFANVILNDGPALYLNTGGLSWSVAFYGVVKNNNQNVSITSATNTGEFHVEGAGTKLDSLNLFGSSHQATGTDGNSLISSPDADRLRLMLVSPRWIESNFTYLAAGSGSNIYLCGVGNNVRPEGNVTGLNFGAVLTDNFEKIWSTGGNMFLGARSVVPNAASGTGDVYIDRSQNPPKWQIDDPTDSAWENM